MFKIRSAFLLFTLLIVPLISGCREASEERALPTVFELPTETATHTPTDTLTPTLTPTQTATFTPTSTPTLTFTPTLSPTATVPPATPTNTVTPRPTNTPFPTLTPPPTVTPTPDAPVIDVFTASAVTAAAGSSVTLVWQASGDIARIDALSPQQQVLQTYSVTPSGQLPVPVPVTGTQVIYRLTVSRGGIEETRSVPVQIQVVCPIDWFFGNALAPAQSGCPQGAPLAVAGKSQVFQHGIMINLTLGGQDRVYGLNSRNNRYMVYVSNWDGTTTYTVPCGTAPAGLIDPQDVFNWTYHNTNGTVGLWCDANAGIGWPTAPANLANTFTVQFEALGTGIFIGVPGYGVLRLSGEPVTGTWQRLQTP